MKRQLSLFQSANIEIDITLTRRKIWVEVEKYNHAKYIIQRNGRANYDIKATTISDMPGGGFNEYASQTERAVVEAQEELFLAQKYVQEFNDAIEAISNFRTNVPEVKNRRKEIFKLVFLKNKSRQQICEELAIGETLYYKEEQEAIKQFARNFGCIVEAQEGSKRKSSFWLEK